MAELLFIAPAAKKNIRKPSWRGLPRVSFTRPAVADKVDPIAKAEAPKEARQTRKSLSVGTVAIILDGEHKGKKAVVVGERGAGIVTLVGLGIPAVDVDQDFLIATSSKLGISAGADEAHITAAAQKIPEMAEYLKAPFTLRHGDRPHLMKF